MASTKQDGVTLRAVAKRTARFLLNGLQGAAIGAIIGVVVAYVAPLRWLRNDPHRWYMIVLFAVVCSVSGAAYTFREPAEASSLSDADDTRDEQN